jgi:hypothetical protein
MKRIGETQLASKVSSLREKIAHIESQQNEGVLGAIGDAVKAGAQKVGSWMGANPVKTAGAAGLAGAAGGAAAMNAAGKPAAKSDPNVIKLQQDLIAKGAKIKADGIMGPATQAAQAQFGGQAAAPAGTTAPPAAPTGDAAKNPVGTTNAATAIPTGGLENPANQAKPAPAPAAPATSTPAAPAVNNPYKDPAQAAKFAALTPQDQAWLTKGGGVPDINDNIILSRAPNGGKPAAAAAPATPAAAPATQTMPAGPAPMGESTTYDDLKRIVSLVHYR